MFWRVVTFTERGKSDRIEVITNLRPPLRLERGFVFMEKIIKGAVALGTVALLAIPAGAPIVSPNAFSLPPLPPAAHPFEKGSATWYGETFHGNLTASGEPFDMHSLTAAHPKLKFGTLVRVTNLQNHLSVLVRINDRGPVHPNSIIDLSYAAAERLGMTQRGRVHVALHRVSE